jgi:hypothetical protein
MPQRLVRHYRSQIRTSYAYIDYVTYNFAGVPSPFATADAVGKITHLVQDGMNLRDYVFTIDNDRCLFRSAQGYMQNSPPFRQVDLPAAKHLVAPRGYTSLFGERKEQSKGFIRYPVFREVQTHARTLGGEVRASSWMVGEELSQVNVPDFFVMRPERGPGGALV